MPAWSVSGLNCEDDRSRTVVVHKSSLDARLCRRGLRIKPVAVSLSAIVSKAANKANSRVAVQRKFPLQRCHRRA
jgi:hypothetical protein